MPIYEYRCPDCRKRTSVFVRSVSSSVSPVCDHCGGKNLSRLMSKFAVHRAAVDFDDESSFADLDESDPRQMARLMRQMSEEAGEDLDPETGDMIARLEAGDDPEAVMAEAESGAGDDDFADDF